MKSNVGLIGPTENKILILSVYEGGEEGELLAELHVEGRDAPADGGGKAPLEVDVVVADGVMTVGGTAGMSLWTF